MAQARGSKLHLALGATSELLSPNPFLADRPQVESIELLASNLARIIILTRTGKRIAIEGLAGVLP